MKKSFLTRIAYTNGLWMVGLLLLVLSAFGNIFYPLSIPEIPAFTKLESLNLFGFQLNLIFKNSYILHFFRFLLLFGSALILQFISSEFRLIRLRSYFPFFLFCVFSAAILPEIPLNGASICGFFFCWSLLRLFGALESRSANRGIFDASVLLAVASLFQFKIILLLPFFWIVTGVLQVFSFKSFSASVVGVLSVFWIIGGVSFLMEDYTFLQIYSRGLISFSPVNFSLLSSAEIAYVSFLGILMVSAMLSFWPRQHLEKLHTRNYINSLLLIWFVLLTLWLFSGNNVGFLLLLFCLSALMVAHFFTLADSFFSRSLFFILIALSIAVYILI